MITTTTTQTAVNINDAVLNMSTGQLLDLMRAVAERFDMDMAATYGHANADGRELCVVERADEACMHLAWKLFGTFQSGPTVFEKDKW